MTDNKLGGILAKVAKIQDAVGHIPKNGTGPASKGSFQYVKYEDILEGIRKELVQNNVITRFETLEHDVHAEQIGGRMVVNTKVLVRYTYIDIEDGSEHISVVGGEGSDIGGDTATRKAYTQAQKVNLLHTFNIVSGDEPDSDAAERVDLPKVKESKPPASDPVSDIRKQITDNFVNNADSPYTAEQVNVLAKRLTNKEPSGSDGWFSHLPSLKKLLAALEAGEV